MSEPKEKLITSDKYQKYKAKYQKAKSKQQLIAEKYENLKIKYETALLEKKQLLQSLIIQKQIKTEDFQLKIQVIKELIIVVSEEINFLQENKNVTILEYENALQDKIEAQKLFLQAKGKKKKNIQFVLVKI